MLSHKLPGCLDITAPKVTRPGFALGHVGGYGQVIFHMFWSKATSEGQNQCCDSNLETEWESVQLAKHWWDSKKTWSILHKLE